MSATQKLLQRLSSVKQTKENCWMAKCPNHADSTASLSVTETANGTVLLHCHAGCEPADVIKQLGMRMADLFPSNGHSQKTIVAVYDYHDERGNLLFQKIRYVPKDFRQRRPDPAAEGGWSWKLNGVRRVLYRLPALIEAVQTGERVCIVEGEKDVDHLVALGFTATTNFDGAAKDGQKTKWLPDYNDSLRGARVAILPDNDEPGRAHALAVARALQGVAAEIKLVELDGLPKKGDVSDWLTNGGTAAQLDELIENAAPWENISESHSPATPGPQIPVCKMDDIGNGERLLNAYGSRLCHSESRGWMYYDGTRWVSEDAYKKAREWAQDTARRIGMERAEDQEAIFKHAARSVRSQAITNMLQEAQPHLKPKKEFDADPWLLNCRNGTLDLRNGKLRPHDPADWITKLAPVEYLESAACPTFERFLDEIFADDKELIDYMRRRIGYCLTGDTSEQEIHFWHGGGSNGKSTLLKILLALLGDYATTVCAETFMENRRNPGSASPDLADIIGTRLVAAIETSEGRQINSALVKALTGGDQITTRKLYAKEMIKFTPEFKAILVTNHRPVINDETHAMWRRIRLISFNTLFRGSDELRMDADDDTPAADKRLSLKLRNELSGILNWAVRGCREWRERDSLLTPAKVRAATDEYRRGQNNIERFLTETGWEISGVDADRYTASLLYQEYVTWCRDGGENPLSRNAFSRGMTFLGAASSQYTFDGKSIRGYIGLRQSLSNPINTGTILK